MYKFFLSLILLLFLGGSVFASSDQTEPKQLVWPFEGIFGFMDKRKDAMFNDFIKEISKFNNNPNDI